MLSIRLFPANTCEKKSGVTELVSSQTAVKGRHGFEIAVRMDNLRGGDWGEIELQRPHLVALKQILWETAGSV